MNLWLFLCVHIMCVHVFVCVCVFVRACVRACVCVCTKDLPLLDDLAICVRMCTCTQTRMHTITRDLDLVEDPYFQKYVEMYAKNAKQFSSYIRI
jgi:hypothetical protein